MHANKQLVNDSSRFPYLKCDSLHFKSLYSGFICSMQTFNKLFLSLSNVDIKKTYGALTQGHYTCLQGHYNML